MNLPDKPSLVTTRPSLWFILALVIGGMISTVQWQHSQALLLAVGLGCVSAFFLVLSAYFFGRRCSPSSEKESLITRSLNSSEDGYLVADKNCNFLYTNPNFHKLLSFAGSADVACRVLSIDAIIESLDGADAEQVERLKSGLSNGAS
jgi:hypothetical protein